MGALFYGFLVALFVAVSVADSSPETKPSPVQPKPNTFCSNAIVKNNLVEENAALSAALKASKGVFVCGNSVVKPVIHQRYLKDRKCKELNAAVFVRTAGEVKFKRGNVNGESLLYPASTYKLTVMVAAINWCKSQPEKSARCLHKYMRPMMQVSDNAATGSIVDIITGAPNVKTMTDSWVKKRFLIENFFMKRGSLGKMRLLTKPYPANKPNSVDLQWAEKELWKAKGRNAMNPNCAGAIMMEIATGLLFPQEKSYMLELMKQDPATGLSWIGAGLPPTSQLYTKIGNAMGNLNEISYIILPDKTEVVLAIFTDCLLNTNNPKANGLDSFARDLLRRIANPAE